MIFPLVAEAASSGYHAARFAARREARDLRLAVKAQKEVASVLSRKYRA